MGLRSSISHLTPNCEHVEVYVLSLKEFFIHRKKIEVFVMLHVSVLWYHLDHQCYICKMGWNRHLTMVVRKWSMYFNPLWSGQSVNWSHFNWCLEAIKSNPTACAASDKRAPGSWVMFRDKFNSICHRDYGILWMIIRTHSHPFFPEIFPLHPGRWTAGSPTAITHEKSKENDLNQTSSIILCKMLYNLQGRWHLVKDDPIWLASIYDAGVFWFSK